MSVRGDWDEPINQMCQKNCKISFYDWYKLFLYRSGVLWEDPDFPAVDASIFYSKKPPGSLFFRAVKMRYNNYLCYAVVNFLSKSTTIQIFAIIDTYIDLLISNKWSIQVWYGRDLPRLWRIRTFLLVGPADLTSSKECWEIVGCLPLLLLSVNTRDCSIRLAILNFLIRNCQMLKIS